MRQLLRRGRAIGWIEEALEPLGARMKPCRRSTASPSPSGPTLGPEPLVWLTDIGGLSSVEAVELMRSSAGTSLQAALRRAPWLSRHHASARPRGLGSTSVARGLGASPGCRLLNGIRAAGGRALRGERPPATAWTAFASVGGHPCARLSVRSPGASGPSRSASCRRPGDAGLRRCWRRAGPARRPGPVPASDQTPVTRARSSTSRSSCHLQVELAPHRGCQSRPAPRGCPARRGRGSRAGSRTPPSSRRGASEGRRGSPVLIPIDDRVEDLLGRCRGHGECLLS